MKRILNLILCAALLSSCSTKVITSNDIWEKQAVLERDEAPHLDNSLEWWYYTGELRDKKNGRLFGIEFVYFNFNYNGKRDRLMCHVAISDPENGQFLYKGFLDKLPSPLEPSLPLVFVMEERTSTSILHAKPGEYTLHADVKGKENDFGFTLSMTNTDPVVMHGNGSGYQRYGQYARAGYYSFTDLDCNGSLWINEEEFEIEGLMWYDRQWNCGEVLQRPDVGWDWMSVRLADSGERIMLYQLRLGGDSVLYGGTLKDRNDSIIYLNHSDIKMRNLGSWKSPHSGDTYYNSMAVEIPEYQLNFTIKPLMEDQELGIKILPFVKLFYWEGLCTVQGTSNGKKFEGSAYLEITNPGNEKK